MRRVASGRAALVLLAGIPVVADAQGARLRLLDSVVVAESANFMLGRPSHLAVGSRGQYFIVEGAEGRIAEVARDGRLVRTWGRQGSGPGELHRPGPVAVSGDSLLTVLDHGNARVTTWDLRRGILRGSFPFAARRHAFHYHDGLLRLSIVTPPTTTTTSTYTPSGEPRGSEGGLPAALRQSPQLAVAAGTMVAADDGNDMYAVFELTSTLYRWKRGTEVMEETLIPVVRRRGVRAGLFEGMMRDPSTARAMFFDRSIPFLLRRIGAGALAFVALDGALGAGGFFQGTLYLTVLDLVGRRACPDLPIPAAPDPLPVIDFRGDTLVVVQEGESAAGEVQTTIRRFRAEAAGCDWVPLAPFRPSPGA